jgi:acetate kinase
MPKSFITYNLRGNKKKKEVHMSNHTEAIEHVKEILLDKKDGILSNINEISAVGHRVAQGGSIFNKSELISDSVIQGIKSLIPLAPLHNESHIQGIEACIKILGKKTPQVAVFDTTFHLTMPKKAYMYAVPYEYYEKYKIRRYGFHGSSHKYVSERYAELTGKNLENIKLVTCHLGNGSSITAIENGKVLDTSMGLTPLDGFMMGTRSGSLDPAIVTYLQQKENLSAQEMNYILNNNSGLLGISGVSSDNRDILKAAKNGNERAVLAHQMLEYQILKYIGAYIAAMNGCDAIVFTAGLGENQAIHRERICENLTFFGTKISKRLNNSMVCGREGKVSSSRSKIDIYVIPTNEELIIAQETLNILYQEKIIKI